MANDFQTARAYAAITPSDSTVYDPVIKAIYVGGAGDVTVISGDGTGTPVTFSAPIAGGWLSVQATKVMSTGTGATNLIACFE